MPLDEPNISGKSNYRKNCTKILRKVNRLKIQVVIYILCVINDCFALQYLSPYFYCVTYAVEPIFAYFDFFW
jgi:hypothetical protein